MDPKHCLILATICLSPKCMLLACKAKKENNCSHLSEKRASDITLNFMFNDYQIQKHVDFIEFCTNNNHSNIFIQKRNDQH